ncbi:hypothetical protein BAAL111456_25265 [Bacillus albus]
MNKKRNEQQEDKYQAVIEEQAKVFRSISKDVTEIK